MPRQARNKSVNYGKEALAIILLALSVFVFLCLISYHPVDPAFNSVSNVSAIKNWGGIVGAYTADFLFSVFGISAYVVATVLLIMSLLQLIGKRLALSIKEGFSYIFLLVFVSSLIHIYLNTVDIRGHTIAGGGLIGGLVGQILVHYLNKIGAVLILAAGTVLSFTLATHITLAMIGQGVYRIGDWLCSNIKELGIKVLKKILFVISSMPSFATTLFIILKRIIKKAMDENQNRVKISKGYLSESNKVEKKSNKALKEEDVLVDAKGKRIEPKILERADLKQRKSKSNQLKFQQISYEGFDLPSFSLLDAPKKQNIKIDEGALKKQSLFLEKKLADFNVSGRVTAIHPGPVITMYEFEPAIGTKINQITNLEDDLALALGGRSVRVIPHLPGKAAVGVEVPNRDREIVYLKDIVSSSQFHKSSSKLTLALGASTDGHPMVTDLTKMPHLLVAGATGSGKSVAIHSMLTSILFNATPEEVRFILVDPKMLELTPYNGIPHLLLPVVTRPKKAILAMRWAVREMEKRYRLLSDSGARNIIGYNEKIRSKQIDIVTLEQADALTKENPEAVAHTGTLPYIVIIIDELADLMMTVSQEMEETITRLAQMARASGIHLILATQRPSVDVITGLIKANFPARIAFRTSARHDSRTILDSNGAESLLGYGDMLFMTPSSGNMMRVHGSFVSENEVARIVSHLKKQGKPIYDESILQAPAESSEAGIAGFEEEDNEIYDKALALVSESKQASISMIQRRMRIGYNRAARLIERMEAQGVVGPADGSKPREVLINSTQR